MLIKLDYRENGIVGIKTTHKNKIRHHYLRFIVDEYSIDNALNHSEINDWLIALDYEGDMAYLWGYDRVPNIPVIVTKKVDSVTEIEVGFIVKQIPSWVRIAIKTPKEFSDMRLIKEISLKYPNVRFCGGNFVRLPGCNIGCIQESDLPLPINQSKIEYITEGCACIKKTIALEDFEGAELLYTIVNKDNIKNKNKKAVIKDLRDLITSNK